LLLIFKYRDGGTYKLRMSSKRRFV
jgi:hypothetical protein